MDEKYSSLMVSKDRLTNLARQSIKYNCIKKINFDKLLTNLQKVKFQ